MCVTSRAASLVSRLILKRTQCTADPPFWLGWQRNEPWGSRGHAHLSAHSTCVPRGWGTWFMFCPQRSTDQFFTPFPAREKPSGLNISVLLGVCVCVCGAHTCARVKACGQHLPSRAVCSGARCTRFRSALADSSLMVLGAGQTTLLVLQAEESGLSLRENSVRELSPGHLAKHYEKRYK